MKFEWEQIQEAEISKGRIIIIKSTGRAKVFGGWVLCNRNGILFESAVTVAESQAMVFIPDPQHQWEIEK